MYSVYSLTGEFIADNYEYNLMKITMKALSMANYNGNCSSFSQLRHILSKSVTCGKMKQPEL